MRANLPVILPASDPMVSETDIVEVIKSYREEQNAHTLVMVGSLVADKEVVHGVNDGDSNLVLVCRTRCADAAPDATHSHLTACVDETIELTRNCAVCAS